MRKPGFWAVCIGWLVFVLAVYGVNSLTLQNMLLQRCAIASLGAVLLIHPVWPEAFGVYYDEDTCRKLIRICAAMEIIGVFAVRAFF